MLKKCLFFVVCLSFIISYSIEAQVTFQTEDSYIGDYNSNISIISADMNNDQQDDLVFFNNNQQLVVGLNNGLKRSWREIEGPPFSGPVWSGLVADFNNDGVSEIVVGTSSSPIRIYSFDFEEESFTLYWQAPSSFLVQNMNASDVDNDGFLDLFLCNDLSTNFLFLNDQQSGFVDSDLIDFNTVPSSDNSGNYGSVFIDFDLDGDRDLYISKCRAGVVDPTDPRRINQLFVQQEDGSFLEMADGFGLDIGAQTWVADFCDLDLDGDLDLVVANHGEPIQMLRNDDGVYTEVSDVGELDLNLFTWQLSFHDFDNDRYPDILISADDTYYFHNNGDWTFSAQSTAFGGGLKAYSHSVGDYNNDGFLDILTAYGANPSTALLDSMWLNQKNDNNWIAFSLEGIASNKDAEGTRVDVFSDGKQMIKHVKIGHSYGIQDTRVLHFGLAEGIADSVKIYWSTDNIQNLVQPEINRKHYVQEMGCVQVVETTEVDIKLPCEGDELEFSFSESTFNNWQDGSSEDIYVTSGTEQVYAEYGDDCVLKSWVVFPNYGDTSTVDFLDVPILDGVFKPCPEQLIELKSEDSSAIWNNNEIAVSYFSGEPGVVTLSERVDCQTMNTTFIREDLSSGFNIPAPVIKYEAGQDLNINVGSYTARWYDDETSTDFFYEGPSYTFQNLESDQVIWIEDYFESSYETNVGIQEIDAAGYTSNAFNPILYFEANATIFLESIKVLSNVEGLRRVIIYDSDENEYFSETYDIIDETVLDLNVELEPGEYSITTDEAVNFSSFGTNGPILARVALPAGTSYPLSDEQEIVRITGSSMNQNFFYSFFDWQLNGGSKICDPRYSVQLEDVLAQKQNNTEALRFNNPIQDELILHYDSNADVSILDLQGKIVYSSKHNRTNSRHDVSSLLPGSYILDVDGKMQILIKI